MNNAMVQMKASTFFTRNSPANGVVLHGDDREKADIAARFPLVTEKDADYLEREGLAERYDGRLPKDASGGDGTGLTIDERAGVFTEHHAEAEDSVEDTTGLATRQSTVFERPIEELAGSGGANRDVITVSSSRTGLVEEPDAPAGRDGQGTSREGRAAQSGGSGGKASGSGGNGEGSGGSQGGSSDGPTPYAQMKKADLEAEAAKEPKVDLSGATNNEERAKLLEKARGAKAPPAAQ